MRVKVLCLCGNAADRSVTAALLGLHEAGVDLTVALPLMAQARQSLAAAGIRVLDDSLSRSTDTRSIRRLRREISSYGYQIVHVLSDSALRSTILAMRNLDARLVARCRSVGNVRLYRLSSWSGLLSSRINGVICETDTIRRQLEGVGMAWGRSRRRLPVTIYKGFDPRWYSGRAADLATLGLPGDAFVVSCLASDIPSREVAWLGRTLTLLADISNLHLLLLGPGLREARTELAAVSKASAQIHYLESAADPLPFVAASDTFVMPFARSDALSESLLGAMACGVPVVAAKRGWSAELIADGESGIVVKADDEQLIANAIRSLHADTALRSQYASAAQERIRRKFTVEGTVTKTFELYQQLLAPG